MQCSHCGNAMEDNARFCDHCGAPLEQKQDSSETASHVESHQPGCLSKGQITGAEEAFEADDKDGLSAEVEKSEEPGSYFIPSSFMKLEININRFFMEESQGILDIRVTNTREEAIRGVVVRVKGDLFSKDCSKEFQCIQPGKLLLSFAKVKSRKCR
jgi:hypothetical protein